MMTATKTNLSTNILAILCLMLVSCDKEITVSTSECKETISINRTKEEAVDIAIKAQNDYFGTRTRGGSRNKSVDMEHVYVKTQVSTRANGGADSLYYIVNFADNGGCAIIAANRNEESLIAITEKGFYSGEPTGVYGFDLYMDETEKRLAESCGIAPQQGPDEMVTIIADTVSLINEFKPSRTGARWDQEAPFNWFCKTPDGQQAPAGCAAIAVAQAMSYYEYPSELTLTFPGHTVDKVPLSWQDMVVHSFPHGDCEYCFQNACLTREIGQRLGVVYEVGDSPADAITTKKGIASVGYTCDDYAPFECNSIVQSLRNNHPVLITGRDSIDNKDVAHMWDVLGYFRTYRHINLYTKSGDKPRIEAGSSKTETVQLYFNYGYGGKHDGYFLAYHRQIDSGLKVSDGGVSDRTIVNIFDGKFDREVNMFTNFKPIDQ